MCVRKHTAISGVLKNGLCRINALKGNFPISDAAYSAGALPSEWPKSTISFGKIFKSYNA